MLADPAAEFTKVRGDTNFTSTHAQIPVYTVFDHELYILFELGVIVITLCTVCTERLCDRSHLYVYNVTVYM